MRAIAIRLADTARRLALRGLLAGVTALAAAPGPAGAQDCRVGDIGDPTVSARLDERVEDQLRCLQSRLDALKQENDALKGRLEVLEDERAAPAAAYRNRDGTVDRKDRYLGPATFVLTGDRRGRPRSLPLDQALVLAMCGDADGCLVSLGLKGIVVDGEPVETMFAAGPCVLHLDGATGAWALSGLCSEDALPPAMADAGTDAGAAAPAWGRAGNARPFGGGGQQGRILLAFAGACLLAEAEPDTRSLGSAAPRFARDARPDLFLVTAGAAWDPTGAFPAAHLPLGPTDPGFECRLTFRD